MCIDYDLATVYNSLSNTKVAVFNRQFLIPYGHKSHKTNIIFKILEALKIWIYGHFIFVCVCVSVEVGVAGRSGHTQYKDLPAQPIDTQGRALTRLEMSVL